MKNLLILIFICSSNLVFAQNEIIESFSNLDTLKIELFNEVHVKFIKYDAKSSIVLNEKLDLPYNYLEQGNYIVGNSSIKLIETTLSRNSDKKHFITFGTIDGPLYGFTIFESEVPYKIIGQIYSTQLIVPGNGFIYSVERENMNFFVKKKYKIEQDQISEITQPFYAVNIDSYALRPITIYQDEEMTKPIATIPKNGAIKILVTKEPSEHITHYLVQSSFGIVGWAKLEADQYKSSDVEGLYYHGN